MRRLLHSLKRRIGYLSLKYKLFILLLAITIFPIALVSYSSQYFMVRSSTEYTSSISSQYVQFVSRDITNYLQDVSQSFDTLFTNSEFQKFLEAPENDLAQQANHIINFRPVLKNALQLRNETVGVLYLDTLGKVYFDSYQEKLNHSYTFEEDPLYQSVYSTTKLKLTVPHQMNYVQLTPENVFSVVRPIINLRTGEFNSWFVIEIRADKIKSMLSDIEYGQGGNLILYDYASHTAVSNADTDPAVLRDFRNALDSHSGADPKLMFSSNGEQYETTYANLPYGEWKLVWMAPLSSLTKGVEQAYNLTILIAITSLAVALIVSFPVMNTILRPLYKLKGGLQSLGRGTYVPIEIRHSNDEIGFVIQSYNKMLYELQSMEQEVYQSKLKEKERELLQLQAQINPHFLFNTLETIESYAVKNNGDAVGVMVQSVSRMMRYTVRNDGGWAPLKEEIAYIHNFLRIHYYRNGTDVMAHFELDPAALEIPIMKLSIQPFVENAIKYGWSPTMSGEEFILTVKAELQNHMLHLSIRDTGAGMLPDVLNKLSKLIETGGEEMDSYFRMHTGIFNVHRRFLLAFGSSVNFRITSQPGQGTFVEIQVPLKG
ncbi:cache domain-containing sensor histidine kinase [Paenibacillus abyssi]|uniref:Sensor histidine kinase n=1 Tax=Paenibacillus abyssi TaxID=1340531 RepID=A0A917D168_9BACL|nr:sensor histidine kinase [Paenibacillus abyssi]GGG05979.1 sensor histidine kinase [Paenibacillus abyssi]